MYQIDRRPVAVLGVGLIALSGSVLAVVGAVRGNATTVTIGASVVMMPAGSLLAITGSDPE